MRRDSLFSIPPDAPFLATLAERVLDGTLLSGWSRTGPFWLSDVTIILPTRRAKLALANMLAARLGGTALLPDIRTFGGEVEDEEPFLPPFDAPNGLAPASPLERTVTLARLVDQWARTEQGRLVLATPPNAAEIFDLAHGLGTVIDDLTIEGGSLSRLDDEIGKLDLANNWQQTRKLLEIAVDNWPQVLAARGRADAAVLRNDRLHRQALAAGQTYGDRPVIAAGSTGSVPATAELIRAIASLPRGVVVLPGLDTSLDRHRFARLLDAGTQPHGHPQHIMAGLLRRLGATPEAVIALGGEPSARTRLVRLALAPPDDTAHWADARARLAPELAEALDGVETLVARTLDEQSRAIAIAARDALAEGLSVGIVSPDQTLSRRIQEDLRRFDIEIDDAAGTPLAQSAAGRLVRIAFAVAASAFGPVEVMSLLDNRATVLGLDRARVATLARVLDMRVLRGRRPRPGVEGLRALVAGRANPERGTALPPEDIAGLEELFCALEAAISPLSDLLARRTIDAGQLARATGAAFEAIVAGAMPAALPEGSDVLRRWVEDVAGLEDPGPAFDLLAPDTVLAALMAGAKVTSRVPRRADIAIWGRLEARLMSPDLLILAGLNEDIWPEPADPGPWLSRGMRLLAGLEPPERQHGQAAHDFEMGMGNARVLLALSERRGTSPALPSRFLQRLEALIGEEGSAVLRARGNHWRDLARRIDLADGPARPATRPVPRPPVALRPKQLSVTEIETLRRSPYDIHAKHVLGLRRVPALGEMPEARDRGTIIHAVFAQFFDEHRDLFSDDAMQHLRDLAADAFASLDAMGERAEIWLRHFERSAEAFLAYERGRDANVAARHAEIDGKLTYANGFTLIGRADRIDELVAGGLEIIDFKTGAVPRAAEMKAFEAPQLLLEADIARGGGFAEVPASGPQALTYIKVGQGPNALEVTPYLGVGDASLADATTTASNLMQALVDAWLMQDDLAMTARLRPVANQRFVGDYDHLARTDEWTVSAGEGE